MVIESQKDAEELLKTLQENEKDVRDQVRESISFMTKPMGQWEDKIYNLYSEKVRYQFNLIYPTLKSISNEILENEFNARTMETDDGTDNEISRVYDGMLRSIQDKSNFVDLAQQSGKKIAGYGFDAWRIISNWADDVSFNQEILIKPIKDAINRVYISPTSEIDYSDISYAFVLSEIDRKEYKKKYPEGSAVSVGEDVPHDEDKTVLICDVYYIKYDEKTIYLNQDGTVSEVEIPGARKRVVKKPTAYMRTMDGKDWLTDEHKTVFSFIPIVPVFGNYDYADGKRVFFGEVENLKDPQRSYNYTKSREISDIALAPIEKINVTPEQIAGLEAEISKLNEGSSPLNIYNHVEGHVPPHKLPGNQPNASLSIVSQQMADNIEKISNSFSPARGEGLTGHSGKAYELLQNKISQGAIEYIKSLKLSITLMGKIIVDAIPRVYDTSNRSVRLLNEDGSARFEKVNRERMERGQMVRELDLSSGKFDVSVIAGPAFKNRRTEGAKALLDIAGIYPGIMELGLDVLVKSLDAPYLDQLNDRVRSGMIDKGLIPVNQLTDEEKEKVQEQMQARQQPDPMEVATLEVIKTEIQKMMVEMQEKQNDVILKQMEQTRKNLETELKRQKTEAEIQKIQSETVENLGESEFATPAVKSAANKVANDID